MSKIFAIVVSFTIIVQSLNFSPIEYTKLADLASHLSKHLQQGDSFISFIDQHYGSSYASHKNEHKEHQNLPFKHISLDLHFKLTTSNQLVFTSIIPFVSPQKKYFGYTSPDYESYIKNLFHPPKLA